LIFSLNFIANNRKHAEKSTMENKEWQKRSFSVMVIFGHFQKEFGHFEL